MAGHPLLAGRIWRRYTGVRHISSCSVFLSVVALSLTACRCVGPNSGRNGRLSFVDETVGHVAPIAANGAETGYLVTSHGGCGSDALHTARSSNESVFTVVSVLADRVKIRTGTAGVGQLWILDEAGAEIDAIDLEVVTVASLQSRAPTEITALEASTMAVPVEKFGRCNAREGTYDCALAGTGALSVQYAGTLSPVDLPPVGFGAFVEPVFFKGSMGAGTARVTAGAGSLTIDVTVQPIASVSSLSAPSVEFVSQNRYRVGLVPMTGSGAAFGGACLWSFAPSSGRLVFQAATFDLSSSPRITAELEAFEPTRATCTVGAVSSVLLIPVK